MALMWEVSLVGAMEMYRQVLHSFLRQGCISFLLSRREFLLTMCCIQAGDYWKARSRGFGNISVKVQSFSTVGSYLFDKPSYVCRYVPISNVQSVGISFLYCS